MTNLIRPLLTIYFCALAAFAWAQSPAPMVIATAEMDLATVKLYAEQCGRGVILAQIEPSYRPQWREGVAVIKDSSESIPLCWYPIPESHLGSVVYIIAEDGTHGPIPQSRFDKEVK